MDQPPGRSSRRYALQCGVAIDTGPSPWIVDPEGRLLSRVMMPIGLVVYEIGSDYVLGLWHDEFGVQHVRRHRLVKSG